MLAIAVGLALGGAFTGTASTQGPGKAEATAYERAARPAPARRGAIPFGAAVSWHHFQADEALPATFLAHFDQVTPENEMKMEWVQPRRGTFNFRSADAIVDFAERHRRRVRGHTLVWGYQIPAWVHHGGFDRDELLEVMREHIHAVVARYRGRVAEWDVVNEALDAEGGWIDNIWYRTIGPDYVEHAFRFAREADPHAKLFYNDFGTEMPNHPHTLAAHRLVSTLKARGVPIDGVGFQGHVTTLFHPLHTDLGETLRRFAALDVDVAITEMDVRQDGGGTREAELAAQARAFEEVARACRLEPRCTSFSTWGIGDRHSWLADWSPLLFDAELRPKAGLAAVEDRIRRP